MNKREVKIYTDGGCNPNPGPGGWGYVIIEEGQEKLTGFGGDTDTTNNKMEITAVLEALNQFDESVKAIIYSDSRYVVNSINSWLEGWIRNNFKASSKTAGDGKIKNEDLWRQMWEYKQIHEIKSYWIRGHAGISHNEEADELATKGRYAAIGINETPKAVSHGEIKMEYDIGIRKNNHTDNDLAKLIKFLNKYRWDYTLIK